MEEKFNIRQSILEQEFAVCAGMMTQSDPWVTLGMTYEHCRKAFEGAFREVYILEIEKDLAGFVILQTQGTFKGYIQTIFMAEPHRGRGYGKKLLQFCEQSILSYSPNLFICVSSFNEGAIKLYEEFGFKKVGVLDNFLKMGYAELLFRKTYGSTLGYLGPSSE